MSGHVFHVINRGARRHTLFSGAPDYAEFQQLLRNAQRRTPLSLFVYCLMSTHIHLVVRPANDQELPEFMRWLCGTHAKRFNRDRAATGVGAVYQGRYRAFPVQGDHHFLRVCRYVERNPLRARLVARAESWPWSSLGQGGRNSQLVSLATWPVVRPANWNEWVNQVATVSEEAAIRECLKRSRPYGDDDWVTETVDRLGLQHTMRRPRPSPKSVESIPDVERPSSSPSGATPP
jgi:putative transposase